MDIWHTPDQFIDKEHSPMVVQRANETNFIYLFCSQGLDYSYHQIYVPAVFLSTEPLQP